MAISIILGISIGLIVGTHIGISTTNFNRPKGLWNFVPFRVGGWKDYEANWVWEDPFKPPKTNQPLKK